MTAGAGPRTSPAGKSLDYSVQAQQQIEIGGQRGARVDSAASSLKVAEAQLESLRVDVASKVREAFGRGLAAERRAKVAGEAFAAGQVLLLLGATALAVYKPLGMTAYGKRRKENERHSSPLTASRVPLTTYPA